MYKGNDKGTSTWVYLKDKTIEVCLVPIDLTHIVEENIAVLANWICDYTRYETEADIPQAQKIAEHFRDNFEEAQDLVGDAHKKGKFPDYMREAFNKADDAEEVSMLLEDKLEEHLKTVRKGIKKR